MAKKKKHIFIGAIIGIILVIGLIGAGVYFYTSTSTQATPKIEETSKDGFATATATFYDKDGNPISSGTTQSIIGGTYQQAVYISFLIKASNTGSVPVNNVTFSSTSNTLNDSFINKASNPIIPTLSVGSSGILLGGTTNACTTNANCDSKEQCIASQCLIPLAQYENLTQPTQFTVTLKAFNYDALGNVNQIFSAPVTLSYDILKEQCTDGTPINTCNLNSKPSYCQFVSGSAPVLINNATGCDCPVGQTPSGNNCIALTCPDGTSINNFSASSGSYSITTNAGTTTRTITSGYETTTKTRVFCTNTQTLETRCQQALATLGTIAQACQPDFYNNPALSCNPATSGVVSVCSYTSYSGSLSGNLSQG